MFAVIGILGALIQRTRTGEGQHIDVSMTDGLVSWLTPQLCQLMNGGTGRAALGEPAYGVFKTSDAKLLSLSIAYGLVLDSALRGVGAACGGPADAPQRIAANTPCANAIAAVIATDTRANWARRLDETRRPMGTGAKFGRSRSRRAFHGTRDVHDPASAGG